MSLQVAFVDSARMAESSGMTLPSFRVALTRSKARRDSGGGIPTDVPVPDMVIGRSPVWSEESLQKWLDARAEARDQLKRRREEKVNGAEVTSSDEN